MCGSSILTSTSSPTLNGSARSPISSRVPCSTNVKGSIARPSLPDRRLGRLGGDFGDRLLEAAFAAAGEAAAVDVDHGQRLGVVDDQVAAGGQVDAAVQRRLDLLVDLPFLEQRLLLAVELDPVDQLRRGALEEAGDPLGLLLGIDDRLLQLAGEDGAEDAHREVGLLEDEGRRLGARGPPLEHLVEPLKVTDLTHEVGFLRPVGGGADDQPARPLVGAVDHLSQPVAFGVREPAADPDAASLRREDEVAAGDRDVHREPRALRLQRVLDHLDEDLLAGFDQLVDAAAAAATAPGGLLAARQDDLVDVQEAVALEADVDERGLHSGKDVVDLPLVDVADDGSPAAALDVELRDVAFAAFRLRLEDGHAGLSTLGGDQNRFFHCFSSVRIGTHRRAPLKRHHQANLPLWLRRAWMLML